MIRRRWRDMLSRLLLVYAVVELAVIFALVSTIGWGWTLLVLLATFLLGWGLLAPMAGSQLIRQLGQLRSGMSEPRSAMSDGALVTVGMALVLVPGLVTTALGLVLLLPPIRSVAGPALAGIALRGLQRRVPLITDTTVFTADSRRGGYSGGGYSGGGYSGGGYSGGGRDYIDGEVIDVKDFEPPILPQGPIDDEPPPRPTSSPGSI